MARVQILPLPTEKVGELEHTPFVIIIDKIADDEVWRDADLDHLKHQTKATTVIGHAGTLDAPGALQLTDEQQAEMIAYLTQPRRWVTGVDFDGYAHAMGRMVAGPGSLVPVPSDQG